MTNQRGELEACAAVLVALDCKLEVTLDDSWVKTGVEQMLSWTERKKQATLRSQHTSESDVGKTLAILQETRSRPDMPQLILNGQTWKQDFSVRKTGRATWQSTSKRWRERRRASHHSR